MSSFATAGAIARANTYTTNDQRYSEVERLADGGIIISWVSEGQDGSESGIYLQRYGADGSMSGAETQVNGYVTGIQTQQSITALAEGGWVLTWTSRPDPENTYGDVFQRVFDENGTPIGPEFRLTSHVVDNQTAPTITALGDGGWIVAWESNSSRSNSIDVFQSRYDKDGNALFEDVKVTQYTGNTNSLANTIALGDGGWLLSWTAFGQDGSSYGVFQQRFDADGNGSVITQVNTHIDDGQLSSVAAPLEDGGWIVTWISASQKENNPLEVLQRRYNADGTAQSKEEYVNTVLTDYQYAQDVTGLADGGWVVVWRSSDASSGIYQQRFDESGNRVGNETLISSAGTAVGGPSVTSFADGSWVVSWDAVASDGNTSDIQQRRFAPDIRGSESAEEIIGTRWSETILARGGNDTLGGGLGSDVLIGGSGNDLYIINSTGDTIRESTLGGNDRVSASVSFTLKGNVESLTLTGTSSISGTGNGLNNALNGNGAANTLRGGGGDDILAGNGGIDSLSGDGGADRFVFRANHTGATRALADTIEDFSSVQKDKIDLLSIDANSNTSGNQAFSFIQMAAFSGVAGQMRYSQTATDTYIYADYDGNKKADFVLHLEGKVTLVSTDFIL